jgi:alkylation response protein AidB-like acyl-CoA dehydrogenase
VLDQRRGWPGGPRPVKPGHDDVDESKPASFGITRQPSNLGAALSTLPRYQEAIGEIDALLYTNTALLDRAAAAAIGEISAIECNFVKLSVTNNAIKIAEKALSLVGNPGLSRANPLERHYRDALCGRVHSPQEDTVLLVAGKFAFASFNSPAA